MKKRITLLLLILLMTAALPAGFAYAAGGSHGEDARSPSMSIDTGEEPITDMSVTQDPGAEDHGVIGDLFGDSFAGISDYFTNIPWKTVGICAAGAAAFILLITLIAKIAGSRDPAKAEKKRNKKLDRGYKPKH